MQLKPIIYGRFRKYWQENYLFIETLFEQCQIAQKIMPDKSFLFQQGQAVNQLILVKTGQISLRYTARNGRRFQLGTMECDDQLFGEMEFFTQYPCQFDIIAEEAITVAIIDAKLLEQQLINYPHLALCFASAIAVDYQDTLDILLKRVLHSIAYNIAYDLLQQHEHTQPVDRFSKNYLEAERFGTTDRVYRRAVSELIDKGLVIRGQDGLQIKNLEKLTQFLHEKSYADG